MCKCQLHKSFDWFHFADLLLLTSFRIPLFFSVPLPCPFYLSFFFCPPSLFPSHTHLLTPSHLPSPSSFSAPLLFPFSPTLLTSFFLFSLLLLPGFLSLVHISCLFANWNLRRDSNRQYTVVPDFTISLWGSSCNYAFSASFWLLSSLFYLLAS